MNLKAAFNGTRKLLGDTFVPYRNTDKDLIDGLTSCIEDLFSFNTDLFLDGSFSVVNDYQEPAVREDTTGYNVGDMIYLNDPLEIYICTVAGTTSDTEPSFEDLVVLDGSVSWSRWEPNEAINRNAIMHYIIYFCLMMDNDEQANGPLADKHYALYQSLR